MNYPCHNASAALIHHCLQLQCLFYVSAIGLTIATTFGAVFTLISHGFVGLNVENNTLNNEINNECELEKSGLSDNGSLCEHISDITSPSNDTVFDFGLAEFIVYGCSIKWKWISLWWFNWLAWMNDWMIDWKLKRFNGIYNLGWVGIVIERLNDWTIDGLW